MTKKETIPKTKPFRLSVKATARLKNYLAQISKGVVNVCELHSYDSAPSLDKVNFEELYIDKVLARTVEAVSASIKAMAEGLQAQKEAEAKALLKEGNYIEGQAAEFEQRLKTNDNPQGENKEDNSQ